MELIYLLYTHKHVLSPGWWAKSLGLCDRRKMGCYPRVQELGFETRTTDYMQIAVSHPLLGLEEEAYAPLR